MLIGMQFVGKIMTPWLKVSPPFCRGSISACCGGGGVTTKAQYVFARAQSQNIWIFTECVKILDGHTTNKIYPSEIYNCKLQSSNESSFGWSGITQALRENTVQLEKMLDAGRANFVGGSKSCICHGSSIAMGGVSSCGAFPNSSKAEPARCSPQDAPPFLSTALLSR